MKYVPRVHGNGFIQLDLTPSRRLHIWGHPEIPRQATPTPLHDHAFGFTSRILLGKLRNIKYDIIASETGAYMVHGVNVRDREDTTLHPTGERVDLGVTTVRNYRAGEKYSMAPGEIHESEPQELSVTIIEKEGLTLSQGGPSPRVFVPVGLVPDNTFQRYLMDEDQLWFIISEALMQASIPLQHIRR